MKIGIVSCSKRKLNKICKAEELYSASALFRYALSYCKKHYDRTYILSTKYGLIETSKVISPYELTVKNFNKVEKKLWYDEVISEINNSTTEFDTIYFHCGKEYYKGILDKLKAKYKIVLICSIGKRLQFYKEALKNG